MKRYKFIFTVPKDHLEVVKEAIFQAGAGRIGDYEHCAFVHEGVGCFRPMNGAKPFLGSVGVQEEVLEYRVETLCEEVNMQSVLSAFFRAHPYEVPAYDIFESLPAAYFVSKES